MSDERLPGLSDKALFRPDEVATYFGKSRKTVYRWCREDKLSYVRVFESIMIPREALAALIRLSSECYEK